MKYLTIFLLVAAFTGCKQPKLDHCENGHGKDCQDVSEAEPEEAVSEVAACPAPAAAPVNPLDSCPRRLIKTNGPSFNQAGNSIYHCTAFPGSPTNVYLGFYADGTISWRDVLSPEPDRVLAIFEGWDKLSVCRMMGFDGTRQLINIDGIDLNADGSLWRTRILNHLDSGHWYDYNHCVIEDNYSPVI